MIFNCILDFDFINFVQKYFLLIGVFVFKIKFLSSYLGWVVVERL